MSWSDKPTERQIAAIWMWIKWLPLSNDELQKRVDWLENNASRGTVASEMTRIRNLSKTNKLNPTTAFSSEVWEGYDGTK